ncbi:MAG: CobD/CbiB family protein [Zoogloeaceae bacterium]|jgi:cobalamin biosynthesis protein CobD/CbiB|nr:CobD/CbiB family protein [Zoogloeaceae bacterium]
MSLVTIVFALLLEQLRPVAVDRINGWLAAWSDLLSARFNAGEWRHGVAAWVIGVALPSALLLAVYALAFRYSWPLALLLGVAFLYATMGFRQFSHHFTSIHIALRGGNFAEARRLLTAWRGGSAERLDSGEVARLTIENALLASHRHVYAPLFWFAILGPAGALLYRLACHFCYAWQPKSGDDAEGGKAFGGFARHAFAVLDWLPVRLTAISFAVVGNFEDAVYCWRTQSARWPEAASGIILSAGAGALGVRLGMPIDTGSGIVDRPELGVGDDADPDFMQSAVGLVWRSLVMVLLLLTLLSVARWAGA